MKLGDVLFLTEDNEGTNHICFYKNRKKIMKSICFFQDYYLGTPNYDYPWIKI